MDELEEKLSIKVRPLSWPINQGFGFKGVYNLYEKHFNFFSANKTKISTDIVSIDSLEDSLIDDLLDERDAEQIRNDVNLIEGVYGTFNPVPYQTGEIAPVFFGSALNNFGVKELLDTFIEIAPKPQPRETNLRMVSPDESAFSGFVFKIHANLDPRHRDRIAFLRVCSGVFERSKFYEHVRLDKTFRFNNPTSFMAQEKEVIDTAYPGDVIGLYDTGNFKIGDTLADGEPLMYKGIPSFSPEFFKEVINADPIKTKQLEKGLKQLTDEGVAQLFTRTIGNRKIIGTVGELQFDVIQFRLKNEYGASCEFMNLPLFKACWISAHDEIMLNEFISRKPNSIAYDKDGKPVFLAESKAYLRMVMDQYTQITFDFMSEHNEATMTNAKREPKTI